MEFVTSPDRCAADAAVGTSHRMLAGTGAANLTHERSLPGGWISACILLVILIGTYLYFWHNLELP